MEMLQLKYFFESSVNQSFAKTAQKYMVPATSVSASVKRLEKELGCELFDRSSNRIILNENGRRLKQSLKVMFEELDSAVDSITSSSSDTREIKMLVRAMRGEITNFIIEYKKRHPNIAFKTVFDFDTKDFEKYDIIIDDTTSDYAQYERYELYHTRVCLKVNSDNPLCGKRLSLAQLSDHPFVSIGENNGLHNILINACKRAGFTPNIIIQSNDISCNRKLVEAGVGIGLGREYSGSKTAYNISTLNVYDFDEKQTICCYYKKDSAYGNVQHFLNFLKSKTKQGPNY